MKRKKQREISPRGGGDEGKKKNYPEVSSASLLSVPHTGNKFSCVFPQNTFTRALRDEVVTDQTASATKPHIVLICFGFMNKLLLCGAFPADSLC